MLRIHCSVTKRSEQSHQELHSHIFSLHVHCRVGGIQAAKCSVSGYLTPVRVLFFLLINNEIHIIVPPLTVFVLCSESRIN